MSFVVLVSKRYLKPTHTLSFASFLTIASAVGVAVGVMALIIVIAVMTGFETDLKSRVMELKPHLVIKKNDGSTIKESCTLLKQLKTIPNVNEIAAFVTTQVIISTSKTSSGAIINGIDNYTKLESSITSDTSYEQKNILTKLPSIILGNELANILNSNIGDEVYLISPKEKISPLGYIPFVKKFYVSGITKLTSDLPEAYIAIDEAQNLLKLDNSVSEIQIRISNTKKIDKIATLIASKLDKSISVKSWKEMNSILFSALKLEKIVTFLILSLTILLATFNITASLAMAVFEKKQEIKILKTMGATNRDISKIFVAKGMIIGTIGTTIGTLIGIIATILIDKHPIIKLPTNVYYVSTLPVDLRTFDVISIILSALLLSFIATIWPAVKASSTMWIQTTNNK